MLRIIGENHTFLERDKNVEQDRELVNYSPSRKDKVVNANTFLSNYIRLNLLRIREKLKQSRPLPYTSPTFGKRREIKETNVADRWIDTMHFSLPNSNEIIITHLLGTCKRIMYRARFYEWNASLALRTHVDLYTCLFLSHMNMHRVNEMDAVWALIVFLCESAKANFNDIFIQIFMWLTMKKYIFKIILSRILCD